MNTIEALAGTGSTLYAICHNPDGTVWNRVNQAFEAFNSANWADYAISLTEQTGSGYFRGVYPSGISGVITTDVIYTQAGIAPALIDAPASGIGQSLGVNLASINMDTSAVAKLLASLGTMALGAVTSSGTSTPILLYVDLNDASDVYQGRLLAMRSGAAVRAIANITAFDPTAHTLALAGPLPAAPAVGDLFIII